MSSSAEARGFVPPARVAAIVLVALAGAAGCYWSHPCGREEVCNLVDDDCDGAIDEDFVDADGVYRTPEACGSCGVVCADVFPTAAEVTCRDEPERGPTCRILRCRAGHHLAGEGACVPDLPVLCLPCTTDEDCEIRQPGARCRPTATGANRCGTPCSAGCPPGFVCDAPGLEGSVCVPSSGICACSDATVGALLACTIEGPDPGHRCAGVMRCGPEGLGACEPALEEACNEQDDDCDGAIDEDFLDEAGRYVSRLHCGGCGRPCAPPGPHMRAECVANGESARCDAVCEEGFVDVNRILADGCECERWTGDGPPPIVGGDANCDGVPDDTDDFIYVSATGSDTNPGTLARPMRSIRAAITRAQREGKDVLVSRGIYDGPFEIVGGVSVYGGYAPDFRDRDPELYPVLIEDRGAEPGTPPLVCRNVDVPTRIEGFIVQGSDATQAGGGSTAVLIERCSEAVHFGAMLVLAGRGADGARGDDSSVNLRDWGLSSLRELDGVPGGDGSPGTGGGPCLPVSGGAGGRHQCRGVDVSGGAGGAAACPGDICRNGSPCANAGCTDYTRDGICDYDTVLRLAVANPPAQPGRGPAPGAAGELTYNAPTNRGVCNFCDDNPTLRREGGDGGDGADGHDGEGGVGCASAPMIDASGRVRAGDGGPGAPGTDGSGGGGGTAGGGYEVIGGTMGECTDRSGGSGGGGGSGGCGAPHADGGTGGGYSIGILIRLDARGRGPTFDDGVRIVTGSGGHGGDGGVGAAGGAGGSGGVGGVGRFWCARNGGRGGDGGRGGAGGGGGGGCGGGSHGVYVIGRNAEYADEIRRRVTIDSAGVAGRGGRGGFSPGHPGTRGLPGSAEPVVLIAP